MLVRHGLIALAACALIALVLTMLGKDGWQTNLVYSLCIGLLSWLGIDLGRLWLTRHSPIGWPTGWQGPALVVCGMVLGFCAGSWLGTHVLGALGWSVPADFWQQNGPQSLVVTVVASSLISWLFYAHGHARHLQAQVSIAEGLAAQAQLALLQAQLEPHMLFNTLANLRVLVASDSARAQDMLDHLIAYLRATLDGSRGRLQSLEQEFLRLDDYLALMAVRMGPRLRYCLQLPPGLAQAQVPCLLLQPLVENSIRHGLEPQIAGGLIQIEAQHKQGPQGPLLLLTVTDNGRGLSAAQTPSVPHSSEGAARQPSQFGLMQVQQRLHSLYGEQAHFCLAAAPAGGCIACLSLPLVWEASP